jgi:hypothetical protein
MSHAQLIRLSGVALVVGAVISFVQTLVSALAFPGQDPTPYANGSLFVPSALIGFGGAVVLMLGLPGLFARSPQGFGVVGLVGLILIFITGLMFAVFFNLFSALLLPYLATHAPSVFKGNGPPSFFPFFIIGTVTQVAGSVLLAIPLVRGRVFPRWPGYVLLASAVLAVVGFFVSGPNGPSNVAVTLLSNAAPLLLFVALGAIGFRMLQGAEVKTDQPVGPTPLAT